MTLTVSFTAIIYLLCGGFFTFSIVRDYCRQKEQLSFVRSKALKSTVPAVMIALGLLQLTGLIGYEWAQATLILAICIGMFVQMGVQDYSLFHGAPETRKVGIAVSALVIVLTMVLCYLMILRAYSPSEYW